MPEKAPKVTVIMPSLNTANYIREALESVLHQTLKELEVLCVDAESSDGTFEILKEYEAKDPRVKVLCSAKKSYGYQVNLGIKNARGIYLGIVETDDFIAPEMYETLYRTASENDLDFVKSNFYRFAGKTRELKKLSEKNVYNQLYNPSLTPDLLNLYMINVTGIYKRSFVLEKEIYMNESPGASFQDNGFWFQVFTQAERAMFVNKAFYFVRRDNPNSSFHSKGKVFCGCEEFDYIREKLKKDPEIEARFAPYCALHRYHHYMWTLSRIADEEKLNFLLRFSEDFKKLQANGELKQEVFGRYWSKMCEIMEDPLKYYSTQVLKNTCESQNLELEKQNRILQHRLEAAEQELASIRASRSYRIGRAVTWLPRKVRGGVRCYREHGFSYTARRVFVHLRLLPDSEKEWWRGSV